MRPLLTIARILLSCVSTSFSICFTAKYVCRSEAETRVTEETCELLVSLDEKQKELTEYQTNVANIKKYASDLQTYLAVKQIEKDVETQDKRIRDHFFNQMLGLIEHT
jgi:Tfp pilus assembly protein PilN